MLLLDAGVLTSMWPLLLMFVVMYFFFLRPQMRKQKQQQQFVNEISKGKEVVTTAGIIGRIIKVEGNIVTLEIDQKSNLRITKSSISRELTEALSKELNQSAG